MHLHKHFVTDLQSAVVSCVHCEWVGTDDGQAARHLAVVHPDVDLPEGFRWAEEEDMDRSDAIMVPRTVSSNGHVYMEDEADLAVPVEA